MRFHPRAQLALCIFFLFALPAAGADDVISVGAATYVKPGQTAEVPVYVRDLTGSPVGKDIEKPIRYLQFTVAFSHPELIEGCTNQTFPACEVAFRTAGVLERKPLAGTPVTFVGGTSIFVRRIVNGTIDWNLDAAEPGDLIGYLDFTLVSSAAPGSEIALTFDPAPDATLLGNQELTVSESIGHGLQAGTGRIVVADCSVAPVAVELEFDWNGVSSDCTKATGGCQTGEVLVFTGTFANPSVRACALVSWHFDDQSQPKIGNPTVHEFAAGGTYEVGMTVQTAGGIVTITRPVPVAAPCDLAPSSVVFEWTGPASHCLTTTDLCGVGETLQFEALLPAQFEECTIVTWNFGDGTAAVVGKTLQHAFTAPGEYTVSVVAATAAGSTAISRTVNVAQQIVCNAIVPATGIVNTSIAFQGTSDIAGSTFLWGFDAFSIELEDPVVPFFGLGTQSWFLQVTHAGFAPCHRNGTIDIVLPTRRRAVRNEVP